MGVLGALFGGSYLAVGGSKKPATQAPPINASSSDEADFIQCAALLHMFSTDFILTSSRKFLNQADQEEKDKAKH